MTLKKFMEKQFAQVHTPLGLASPDIFSVMPYKAGHASLTETAIRSVRIHLLTPGN